MCITHTLLSANRYNTGMKKQSLSERILAYYQKHPGVHISGGEIERLVAASTTYKASNASRRLRELHEDGKLKRDEVKGTVFYWYTPTTSQVPRYRVENGVAVQYLETVTA